VQSRKVVRWAYAGAIVLAAAGTAVAPRAGQGQPKPSAKSWTVARTPWGDPDLQGNYTNKYETSTPFERPAGFEGRRLEDVTAQELAEAVKRRQQDTLDRAKFLGGDPEGRIGNSAEFRDIYEITKGSRPWFVTDPPDGKVPPLTPEGQRRAAAAPRLVSGNDGPEGLPAGPENLNLWNRCITRGLPGSMIPGVYGNSYRIVQGAGWVGIIYEMVHEARVIRLDGAPHVGKAIRLDMGDARGRWEGATLIVETTNFKERSAYRNANPDMLRLVERFTRAAADRIDWSVTVDDPSTWTRPWTFAVPLTVNDREAVYEYACHEGNYGLHNILSAARAIEREREGR
jgi:hypothetical protein